MGVTRKQLREFGASAYLVQRLTKALQPMGRQGRAYDYAVDQVIGAIRRLLTTPRVRKTTKAVLTRLEVEVSGIAERGATIDPLSEAMQRMAEANTQFEQTAQQAQRIAGEHRAYQKGRGAMTQAQNNIASFVG